MCTLLQLQMDCGKFQITDEEESWISKLWWKVHFYDCVFLVSIDNAATPVVALLSGLDQRWQPNEMPSSVI